jgi:hypothetical protein
MKFKEPCSSLNDTEKAYIAGIIDGEGCLRIDSGKNGRGTVKYCITVSVSNTNFGLIEYLNKITNVGSVFLVKKKGNRRPQLRWMVFSKQAEEFINQILPFLRVKKPQAEILLESRKYNRIPGRKGLSLEEKKVKYKLYEKMKELNQRGMLNERS